MGTVWRICTQVAQGQLRLTDVGKAEENFQDPKEAAPQKSRGGGIWLAGVGDVSSSGLAKCVEKAGRERRVCA